jgi:hypothetical protein
MEQDIVCKECGNVNDYRTEMKANNKVAYCNGCGNFIKNIPYETEPKMYFGKYKGQLLRDITDREYLHWLLYKCENVKPKQRSDIERRHNELKEKS